MNNDIYGDLCNGCCRKVWMTKFKDFEGLCKPGDTVEVTCNLCGRIMVDAEGNKISSVENYKQPTHYYCLPYDEETVSGVKRFKKYFNRLPEPHEAILFKLSHLKNNKKYMKKLTLCKNWELDLIPPFDDDYLNAVNDLNLTCEVIRL